jgi:hypothetical protein
VWTVPELLFESKKLIPALQQLLLAASIFVLKGSITLFTVGFSLFNLILFFTTPALATISQEVVPVSLKGLS